MEINDTLILLSLTQAEINSITSPTESGLLYNSTTNTAQFYDGTSWVNTSISNTDDLPEGAVNLYYTDARVTANSSVTANTAKVTNQTHTGEVTGSIALVLNSISISNKTLVTAASGMEVLVNDGGVLKKVNANDFIGSGGGGDMLKSIYDPTNVNADAFDYANAIGLTQSTSVSYYTATGNVNNFDFGTANVVFFDGDGSDRNFTGIVAPPAGVYRIVTLINVDPTNKIKLKNNSTSVAANRLLLRDNINKDMKKQDSCRFIYDHTANRWRNYGAGSH